MAPTGEPEHPPMRSVSMCRSVADVAGPGEAGDEMIDVYVTVARLGEPPTHHLVRAHSREVLCTAEPAREADILTVHASELGTLGACHRCLALVDRRADDILLIVED
jgi:hypothetical protein